MTPPTTFHPLPAQDDLAQMPRDLRFHPSANPSPKKLTQDQIDQFNRDGYLKGIRIFSKDESDAIRAYFDDLLSKVLAAGGDSYSISTAHAKYGKVWDLLTEPRIVAVVKDLLGTHVIGWGSHFFCKMPGDGKTVSWHQDASYWPLSPSKAVTVWLAIDDADRGNACMKFIPGSHHYGHLTYKMTEDSRESASRAGMTCDARG
jgi:non-heme Fe2+,alpha-ketoglutarate-dependent halogenase